MKTKVNTLLHRDDTLLQKSAQAPKYLDTSSSARDVPALNDLNPLFDGGELSFCSTSSEIVPPFHGRTTEVFDMEIAKSALMTTQAGANFEPCGSYRFDSNFMFPDSNFTLLRGQSGGEDPLWQMSRQKAVHLCRLYERVAGASYPVVDIDNVIRHVNMVFDSIEAAKRFRYTSPSSAYALNDDDCVVRIILALGCVLEQGNKSEMGKLLFTSVQQHVNVCFWKGTTLKQLVFLVITVCSPSSISSVLFTNKNRAFIFSSCKTRSELEG